jgi:hypothetical protein
MKWKIFNRIIFDSTIQISHLENNKNTNIFCSTTVKFKIKEVLITNSQRTQAVVNIRGSVPLIELYLPFTLLKTCWNPTSGVNQDKGECGRCFDEIWTMIKYIIWYIITSVHKLFHDQSKTSVINTCIWFSYHTFTHYSGISWLPTCSKLWHFFSKFSNFGQFSRVSRETPKTTKKIDGW